jgi:hypothetical protein
MADGVITIYRFTLTPKDRKFGSDRLRYEARLAHLDGRNARALELNRKADVLDREQRSRNARFGYPSRCGKAS